MGPYYRRRVFGVIELGEMPTTTLRGIVRRRPYILATWQVI